MNEATVTLVNDFAKATRVSKAKLTDLVAAVLAANVVVEKQTRSYNKVDKAFEAVYNAVGGFGSQFVVEDLEEAGVKSARYMLHKMEASGLVTRVCNMKMTETRGRPNAVYVLNA